MASGADSTPLKRGVNEIRAKDPGEFCLAPLSPVLVTFGFTGMGYGVNVDRAKCGFPCVCQAWAAALPWVTKKLEFNVVLSQEGRAKNPALLIFDGVQTADPASQSECNQTELPQKSTKEHIEEARPHLDPLPQGEEIAGAAPGVEDDFGGAGPLDGFGVGGMIMAWKKYL